MIRGTGVGVKMSCADENQKFNWQGRGGRLLGTQEYVIIFQEWHQFLRTQKRPHFNLNSLILTLVVSLPALSRY